MEPKQGPQKANKLKDPTFYSGSKGQDKRKPEPKIVQHDVTPEAKSQLPHVFVHATSDLTTSIDPCWRSQD